MRFLTLVVRSAAMPRFSGRCGACHRARDARPAGIAL